MASRRRQRSVPPRTTTMDEPSSSLSDLGTSVSTPPSFLPTESSLQHSTSSLSSSSSQPAQGTQQPKLMARAEALARMTFELNIRAVSSQADRLQRDLQSLVQSRSEDHEFCVRNKAGLEEIWREVTAVKQHVASVEAGQLDAKEARERCQRETAEVVGEFRGEVSELRELLDGLAKQVDQLPTLAETMNDVESGYNSLPSDRARLGNDSQESQQSSLDDHDSNIKDRIREAINSTRRWNRDHKTTKLADAEFTASYLRQQSKRDAALAVFIQRAIGKRVRRRLPRSHSRPVTLEEFCQDVVWKDVLDTVEDVLVKDKSAAMQAIR